MSPFRTITGGTRRTYVSVPDRRFILVEDHVAALPNALIQGLCGWLGLPNTAPRVLEVSLPGVAPRPYMVDGVQGAGRVGVRLLAVDEFMSLHPGSWAAIADRATWTPLPLS